MYSWEPGNRVWWRSNPKDDTKRAPAVVRKVCPKRISIDYAWQPHGEGGKWFIRTTSVKAESLSPRNELCEHLGEKEAADV